MLRRTPRTPQTFLSLLAHAYVNGAIGRALASEVAGSDPKLERAAATPNRGGWMVEGRNGLARWADRAAVITVLALGGKCRRAPKGVHRPWLATDRSGTLVRGGPAPKDLRGQEDVMGALVVFESMYGNTWQVAESIAEGLSTGMSVEVVEVTHAPREFGGELDLLVVGAPTHVFGLSRDATRAEAAQRAGRAVISAGDGVREWLDAIELPRGLAVAAFDTHSDSRWAPGSAAGVVRRRLRRMGGEPVRSAESFYVEGTEGPLLPGEIERARAWGISLARRMVETDAGTP